MSKIVYEVQCRLPTTVSGLKTEWRRTKSPYIAISDERGIK
jgi:hypothetical protein